MESSHFYHFTYGFRFCRILHFYHFTPKVANFYRTLTLWIACDKVTFKVI
jgi:hypothetical protein